MAGRRVPALTAGAVAAAAVLTGCARAVPMDPGPSAAEVACSQVMVLLPEALGDRERRKTTAQATAAWAVPGAAADTAVTMTCGVEPPGPSTDPCATMGGVDWVATEHESRIWYTSYGRSPAVRISIPRDAQDGTDEVLSAVAASVAQFPAERTCS